jgi:rhodanese-related sulfurtransferase
MKVQCRRSLLEAGVIVLAALAPSVVSAIWSPHPPAWSWFRQDIPELELEQVATLGPPLLWVDARNGDEFRVGHISGAVSLNEEHWNELLPGFVAAWAPGTRIVVYCDPRGCNASRSVATRIHRELRIENVFVLQGGWKGVR